MKTTVNIALTAAFCLAAAPAFSETAQAEETETYQLPTVFVRAEMDREALPGGFIFKKARNGILGGMDIMDIPFTQFNYTEKTVETFGDASMPLNLVLTNNPAIRNSSTSPMYTDFSIRGINANGNNIYFNGVPNLFAQFLSPPNHIIGSIDIMSGPNTVLNGSTTSVNGTNGNTAPNGIISIMSKRALAEPLTRYTQTFSGRGAFGEYLDFSRRFGERKSWGLRVNAQYLDGDLAVPGMGKEERNVFVNFDYAGDKSVTNFFGGYFDLNVTGGQRWFALNSASTGLMSAPDAKKSFDYEGMRKIQRGYIFTLNHDHELSENWTLFANLGMTDRDGYKYDENGGSLALMGHTGVISSQLRHMVEANRNEYAQAGLRGKIQTGEITNNISLSWDWSWVKNYSASRSGAAGSVAGSLGRGVTVNQALPVAGPANLINHEITRSITLADHLEYKNFGLIVALQRRDNQYRAFNAAGRNTEKSNHVATNPSYAITYKPIENLLLYASHSESYTRARTVGSGYENEHELLKPVKNKLNEIGVKYQAEGLITTLSFFSVDQRSFRDENIGALRYLRSDGKNEYKGVEWNINGQITPKLNIMGGLLYLDAKRKNTAGGTYDGMYVPGVAKWSGVLAAEYEVNEDNSFTGRMLYSGPAHVTDANKVKVPSWVSFDLGYQHHTTVYELPVTFRANCYNVLNKDYWVARGGSSTIGLSMPRSFMLTAQFDF